MFAHISSSLCAPSSGNGGRFLTRAQGHADQVAERDRIDSTRKASPLVIPTGATVIDNSHLTLDQAVESVLNSLETKGLPTP